MSQAKQPHPALCFSRARMRSVKVDGQDLPVWMAPDIDQLLNDFIQENEQSGEELGNRRCPFGAVLWPSARALWQWLNEAPNRWSLAARQKDDCNVQALELGSGVGFFAALLAANTRWSITASDYEPAYEDYLKANCNLHHSSKVPFVTLDWCEPAPEELRTKYDLIIACDVFYDDTHLDSVPRIASELLKPDGTLLLADPERFRFQSALEKLKTRFNCVSIYSTIVEHTPDDAQTSGVISRSVQQTGVQIVHCQNPLI